MTKIRQRKVPALTVGSLIRERQAGSTLKTIVTVVRPTYIVAANLGGRHTRIKWASLARYDVEGRVDDRED